MVTIIKVKYMANGTPYIVKDASCYMTLNVNSVLAAAHEVAVSNTDGTYCIFFGRLSDVTDLYNAQKKGNTPFAEWIIHNCAVLVRI